MFKYDAFIAYSSLDVKFASKLERTLEKYKIPKTLQNKLNRDTSTSYLNIFRDTQDIIGNELTPALKESLRLSKKLLVIVSPNSKKSKWVGLEIETFIEFHGKENIIPIILDGDPSLVSGENSPYHPKLLTYLTDPLVSDFRLSKIETFFERRSRLFEAKFQIIAQILGVLKSDLIRRYRLQQRLFYIGLMVAFIAFIGFFKYSYDQTQTARKEKAGQLFAIAESKPSSTKENLEALAYTLEAIRISPATDEARLNYLSQARSGLKNIPFAYGHIPLYDTEKNLEIDSKASSIESISSNNSMNLFGAGGKPPFITENSLYVAFIKDENLMVWNTYEQKFQKTPINNKLLAKVEGTTITPYLSEELDLGVIVEMQMNQTFMSVWQLSTGVLIKRFAITIPTFYCRSTSGGTPSLLNFSPDGQHVILNIPCTGSGRGFDESYVEKETPGSVFVYIWSIEIPTMNPSFETNTDIFKSNILQMPIDLYGLNVYNHEPYLTNSPNGISITSVKNNFKDNQFNLNIIPLKGNSDEEIILSHNDPVISICPIDDGNAVATVTINSDGVFHLWIWNLTTEEVEHHQTLINDFHSVDWYIIESFDSSGNLVLSDSNKDQVIILNYKKNKCYIIPLDSASLVSVSISNKFNLLHLILFQKSELSQGKYIIQTWDWNLGYIVEKPFEIPGDSIFKIGQKDAVYTLNIYGYFYAWRLPENQKLTHFNLRPNGLLLFSEFLNNGDILLIYKINNPSSQNFEDCQFPLKANFSVNFGVDFSTDQKQYEIYLLEANSLDLVWKEPISIFSTSDPVFRALKNELHVLAGKFYSLIDLSSGKILKKINVDFEQEIDSMNSIFSDYSLLEGKPYLGVSQMSEFPLDLRFGREVELYETTYKDSSLNEFKIDKFWTESKILAVNKSNENQYLTFSEHGFLGIRDLGSLNEISEIISKFDFNISEVVFGFKITENNEILSISDEEYIIKRREFVHQLELLVKENNNYAGYLLDFIDKGNIGK